MRKDLEKFKNWLKHLFHKASQARPKAALNPARHPGYFLNAEYLYRMKSHIISGCNTQCDFNTLRHWIQ